MVITGPDRYEGFLQWQKFHRETGKDVAAYEHWVARKTDLHRHLLRQLEDSGLGSGSYRACRYMITRLTDEGYLRYNRNEAAEICYANSWDVELAEGMLQSMDPIGVGTADGAQCVRFQLKSGSPAIPKPGIRYRDRAAEPYVVPDIVIRRGESRRMLPGYDRHSDAAGGQPLPVGDSGSDGPDKNRFSLQLFPGGRGFDLQFERAKLLPPPGSGCSDGGQSGLFLGAAGTSDGDYLFEAEYRDGNPLPEVEGILRGKYGPVRKEICILCLIFSGRLWERRYIKNQCIHLMEFEILMKNYKKFLWIPLYAIQ